VDFQAMRRLVRIVCRAEVWALAIAGCAMAYYILLGSR
jgi:hypothetical protein